jgi:hypothetical protein
MRRRRCFALLGPLRRYKMMEIECRQDEEHDLDGGECP